MFGSFLSGLFHSIARKANRDALDEHYRNSVVTEPVKPVVDFVVEAVRADLLKRSQLGIKKYGTTLDRTDLSIRDWFQHAYEETLDQANYLKRCIMDMDNGTILVMEQKTAKNHLTRR